MLIPVLLCLIFVQMSVHMISWNRDVAKNRLKANLEYQYNLKTEMGLAQIEESLERLTNRVNALISGSEASEALGRSHRPPQA